MRLRCRWSLPLVLAALALGPASAQESSDDLVTTIEGEELHGAVVGLDGGAIEVRLADGQSRRVELDAIDRIDFAGAAAASAPEAGALGLWLRSGQALVARFLRASPTGGVFEHLPGRAFDVQWRFVQAVRFAPGDAPEDPGFAARVAEPLDDLDLLWATAADGTLHRLSVQVVGVSDDRTTVRFQGEERTMALERVHGIVFARAAGARPDALPNPRAVVELGGGREVAGQLAAVDGVDLTLRLDEGFALAIPRSRVAGVRVRSDRLLYLTDLVAEVEQTPAFDMTWPPLIDEGPGGGPIFVRGRAHRRGLVLVPRARLSYKLDHAYEVFEATIAQEDRAGDRADAVLRVLGDGEVLFDSGSLTRMTAPRAIRVPIKGVANLALEADFGAGFDLGDLCAFASARVRKE